MVQGFCMGSNHKSDIVLGGIMLLWVLVEEATEKVIAAVSAKLATWRRFLPTNIFKRFIYQDNSFRLMQDRWFFFLTDEEFVHFLMIYCQVSGAVYDCQQGSITLLLESLDQRYLFHLKINTARKVAEALGQKRQGSHDFVIIFQEQNYALSLPGNEPVPALEMVLAFDETMRKMYQLFRKEKIFIAAEQL